MIVTIRQVATDVAVPMLRYNLIIITDKLLRHRPLITVMHYAVLIAAVI